MAALDHSSPPVHNHFKPQIGTMTPLGTAIGLGRATDTNQLRKLTRPGVDPPNYRNSPLFFPLFLENFTLIVTETEI
jgi:hypothetical protein